MLKDVVKDAEVRVKVFTFPIKDVVDVRVWFVWHSMEDANHPGLKDVGSWLDSHREYTALEDSEHSHNCKDLLCFIGERDG